MDCDPSKITTKALPKFTKIKHRCIAVTKKDGYVFGISSHCVSVADIQETLFQIEVEYWSKILPENTRHNTSDPKIISYLKLLLNEIIFIVEQSGYLVSRTAPSKIEWLESL